MKLNILALSALLALAAAADSTTSSQVAATTSSAEVECAKSCEAKDLCCIAKCYKVPCPSESQANDTNSCVAACPQGTGTPADTEKYTNCQQNCFSSHFFPANGGAATTHTTSKTTAATGSSATQTNAEASGSKSSTNSASSTSGSASASATNAATNVKMSASGAGLFGLMLAAFAL